ncbi:DUF1513 domain-containing protein [Endozoicomonas sp.]|uniref:DUF1513 domain-containing protein n=1 Tax=Endozoicomonas sp. TaxID=1892382 RepID=UPI003AF50A05
MHRRVFIKSALILSAIGLTGTGCTSTSRHVLASAAMDSAGNPSIRLINPYKAQSSIIPVPERLHDACLRTNTMEVIVFERRPGYRFYVVDVEKAQIYKTITMNPQRHLYGHGVFSQDGKWLYTTENNLSSLQGAIGIYDAEQGYKRTGEWLLPSPGPHEIQMMPDGETLVVAVGGIKTHPDTGRKTLNPGSLEPSLVYLNRHSGKTIEQRSFVDPHLSIRHLDIASDGTVAIGMQHQGSNDEALPLVATHQRGNPIQAIKALPEQWLALKGYIASVALLSEADTIAVTSPTGNRVALIQKSTGQLKSFFYHRDCAGITPLSPSRLAVSNGFGEIQVLECLQGMAKRIHQVKHADCRWDNHILRI